MKRWILSALAGAVALVITASWLAYTHGDAPPRGEGSYRAAEKIHTELKTLRAGLPELRLPEGYCKFSLPDGRWYVATGIDSHTLRDGGTLGILTSDGEVAVFFTHICGPGTAPREFLPGASPAEMVKKLRAVDTEWKPTP